MQISLNIATGGHVPGSGGLILPQLASGPTVTGDGFEGSVFAADASDSWTHDGAAANVLQRRYRLLVDGAEAVPAGPDASLNVPIGTVGGLYQLQLRVEIAAPAGLWSRWQTIASGTVQGAPQLSAVSAAPMGGTGYTGTVTTDTGAGTLYWMASTASAPPATGALKAAESQPVTASGVQSISGGALVPDTAYHLHVMQDDGAGHESAVLSSGVFMTVAPQGSVPAAFGPGDWSITDLGSGGDARLTITALPDDGGDALTALFYSIDGGARVRLPSVAVGSHDLMDLFTDGVPATVGLRAENLYGPGPESAPKPITTTGPQTDPDTWQITDTGDGRFTLASAPPPGIAPQITNNGDGSFSVLA
jgi:hypothetical protein